MGKFPIDWEKFPARGTSPVQDAGDLQLAHTLLHLVNIEWILRSSHDLEKNV
jgi:hypothetical protein